jgi:hypothetical protein
VQLLEPGPFWFTCLFLENTESIIEGSGDSLACLDTGITWEALAKNQCLRIGGMAKEVENLLCKLEALSSNPSSIKKKGA